jgi:hypothetical protein
MNSSRAAGSILASRQRRRLLAAAIVGLVAVLIAGLLLVRPWDRAAAATQPTAWQAITDGITGDQVPLDTGLQAFAYLTGVDIPGVRVPVGAPGDDAPTSATGALRWVRSHWNELTPEQRAAVEGITRPRTGDLVLPVTGQDGEPLARADRLASVDAGPPDGPPLGRVTNDAKSTVADAVRDDLFATITHIGQKLGLPVIREGLFLKDVTLTLTEDSGLRADGTYTFWLTQPVLEGDNYSPCNVTLYKNLWSKETAGQPLSATVHVTLTHEVIHCYQYLVVDDVFVADLMPPWIMEGSAIWLAGNDTGIVEPMTPGLWTNFIMGKPQNALTSRTYDAYGWYALLDHLGRPMWDQIADAWRAARPLERGLQRDRVRRRDRARRDGRPGQRSRWRPSWRSRLHVATLLCRGRLHLSTRDASGGRANVGRGDVAPVRHRVPGARGRRRTAHLEQDDGTGMWSGRAIAVAVAECAARGARRARATALRKEMREQQRRSAHADRGRCAV